MKFNEFKGVQFDLKYEEKVHSLLRELDSCLDRQYSILVRLSTYLTHRSFHEGTVNVNSPEFQDLFAKFKDYTLRAYDLIIDLKETVNVNIRFKDEDSVSKDIQDVVEEACIAKHKYERMKEYLPVGLVKLNDSMNDNLSKLTAYINEYNKKFSASIITVPQARAIVYKQLNETLDRLIEDVERISKARGPLN